jgi:hypothetical protein
VWVWFLGVILGCATVYFNALNRCLLTHLHPSLWHPVSILTSFFWVSFLEGINLIGDILCIRARIRTRTRTRTTAENAGMLMFHLLVGILLVVLVQQANGFIVGECPGNYAENVCAYTPTFVTCPIGYYCPFYPDYMITQFNKTLADASCIVGAQAVQFTNSSSYLVVCPCQPGFFCPADTETPQYCLQGNYCPPDTSITTNILGQPIPATGLGAWGGEMYQCPKVCVLCAYLW